MSVTRQPRAPSGATATATPPGPGQAGAAAPAFAVYVSRDKLSVLLDCPDPLADLADTVGRIGEAFRKLKLPEYPDDELLERMLKACARPGEPLDGQPLIMGYAPEPPRDGCLEWTRDYFAGGWAIDPRTGAIDFWARLDNRAVTAGELLVRLLPPLPGEPGLNVFGAKVPAAKPRRERLRCGKGVVQETGADDVAGFRSTVDGRVRLNDGTVSVDEVYVIKGNLGLETGNVRHAGTLQVEGDIQQGVTIEVGGDVAVRGMIEPCRITAGGSLQAAGGIVGQDGCRIRVGGGLQAKYLRDAEIDAVADVTVGSEISHSTVRTLGRVLVPNGRIAGGTTTARAGITVGQAGASGATGTVLVVGVDYLIESRVAHREEDLAALEESRRLVLDELAAVRRNGRGDPHRAPGDNEPDPRVRELDQAIAQTKASISGMIADSEAACGGELAATCEVWSGTVIQLGNERLAVRASVRKPRLARLVDGCVRLLPLGEGNMPDQD